MKRLDRAGGADLAALGDQVVESDTDIELAATVDRGPFQSSGKGSQAVKAAAGPFVLELMGEATEELPVVALGAFGQFGEHLREMRHKAVSSGKASSIAAEGKIGTGGTAKSCDHI